MITEYFRYEGNIENTVLKSYGDFIECNPKEHKKSELYIIPDGCSGSDFSGGVFNKSNYRAFLEMFGDVEGVYKLWGGFGTYAIAIRLDVYESNEEIKKVIDDLDDYCIIDEEDLSKLEYELQNKAWENWVKYDMLRLIQSSHELLEDFEEKNLPEKDFESLFYRASHEANEYWEPDGNDMSINLKNIAPYLRDRILVKIIDKKDLPLLIAHDWKSEEAKKEFTKLFSIKKVL